MRTERSGDRRIDRVVLLGYMTSGKSSVGAALARRIGWGFVDLDVEIENREGRSIAEIVETRGEEDLRRMEAAITSELTRARELVLAPGGGWITNPALLESMGPGTLSVWLMVSPGEVVRRLRRDSNDRPFQHDPDPIPRIEAMLAERQPLYELADLTIPTDGLSPDEVAVEIERAMTPDRRGASDSGTNRSRA